MRGVHVAQVPMRAMLITSVLVVATSLSLVFSHSAGALPLGVDDLLRKTVQPVVQLLPTGNSQPPLANNESAQTNSPAGTGGNAASPNAPTNQASMPTTAVSTTPSMASEESSVEPIDPLAPIDTSDMRQPLMPLVYLANADTESSGGRMAPAGAGGIAALPIQASEEGWRLFGFAWYWWLVAAGAIFCGIRYLGPIKRIYSSASQ